MKRQRIMIFALILVVGGFGLNACNRNDQGVEAANESISGTDQQFTRDAAMSHVMEIEMARIAQQKAQDEQVRDFAETVEQDHKAALEDLMEITQEKGITHHNMVPDKEEMARMQNLGGVEFDREFMNMMVASHQESADKFRRSQGSVQNEDLREYMESVVPTVEKHLTRARELQSKLFNGNKP